MRPYTDFLKSKVRLAKKQGFEIEVGEISNRLKPHQKAITRWMVQGGRRACFAAFGLGKSIIQLETVRLTLLQTGGRGLIVVPLNVRQEFINDARNVLGWADSEVPKFIRRIEDAGDTGIYLTNYETVRDNKLDPAEFKVASLDEASILRGFGGTKTFREVMRLFTGEGSPSTGKRNNREDGKTVMGLHRAGYDVTGVDIKHQPRYPFRFIQGDALAQDLSGYDFVWASPPCQGYSALKTMLNAREHPKLIEEVRAMLTAWGGPWIIENVEGAKNELRNPVMLCGSMFGLESNGFQLRRHRYFESNVPLTAPGPCRHAAKTLGVYGAKVRDIAKEKRHYGQPKETRGKPVGVVLPQAWGFEAMGCDWMKIEEASEAIPPAFSEYLARQTLRVTARHNE